MTITAGLLSAPGPSLAQHRHWFGDMPQDAGPGLIDTLRDAGLTGRGGAGFPTARKLAAVTGRNAVVVANGAEGEPLSHKDATLLARAPHLVLDGLCAVGAAVAATQRYLYVPQPSVAVMRHALEERAVAGWPGADVEIVVAPEAFVAGEESAVLNRLEGGPARPRDRLVIAAASGVRGRPTALNNVETLAHIALIARRGAPWFRSVGHGDDAGTMLVTVSGAVRRPGVFEVGMGIPLTELIGGFAQTDPRQVRAVLIGGYHGAWVGGHNAAQARLSRTSLQPYGAGPGAGVVHVLGAGECGLGRTADIVGYLATQSAGQCGPCVNGLPRLAELLADLAYGHPGVRLVERIVDMVALVDGRGSCRHPDGTARLVRSALQVFADEAARR
ncbi:MAG: SLBB domain-containing protein [Mycobacterium sp.]|nr:SLBB domain-containing protein [Mycobacterium sp.]